MHPQRMCVAKNRLQSDAVLHDEEDFIISLRNVHKTYLLGLEGVAALRYAIYVVLDAPEWLAEA